MNFRRILVASGHLWKSTASLAVASPSSLTAVASLASLSAAVASPASAPSAAKVGARKRKLLSQLRNLKGETVQETLDAFFKEEDGVSITKADLFRWANRLYNDRSPHHACQIFEWMERKKMTFSPSELENCVDLISKTKSIHAAVVYFEKVDSDFDNMDPHAKNWPAYTKIFQNNHRNVMNSRFGYANYMIP